MIGFSLKSRDQIEIQSITKRAKRRRKDALIRDDLIIDRVRKSDRKARMALAMPSMFRPAGHDLLSSGNSFE